MDEYLKKWGTRGLSLLVAKLIEKAPTFQGDTELAKMLGEACADLESALTRSHFPK